MPKVPLSAFGLATLQSDLYALPDPELIVEAEAVRADFVSWVDNHIDLTPAQFTWLGDIDTLFLDLLSVKTAIAFRNRVPFTFDLASGTGSGKWFMEKSTLNPKWEAPGVITATGVLAFETGYI